MDLQTEENKHQDFKKNNRLYKNKITLLNTSEEDITSHKLMVKSIKEALWNKYNY